MTAREILMIIAIIIPVEVALSRLYFELWKRWYFKNIRPAREFLEEMRGKEK